nr:immunoglobulin heavy chain junction region [Macaca mulatta]
CASLSFPPLHTPVALSDCGLHSW